MINDITEYGLIIKMLKLGDNIVEVEPNIKKYNVSSSYYSIDIYYEKEETEEEKKLKDANINKIKASIERRKKLLANENYVSKAPKELVESENLKLKEEEDALEKLINS